MFGWPYLPIREQKFVRFMISCSTLRDARQTLFCCRFSVTSMSEGLLTRLTCCCLLSCIKARQRSSFWAASTAYRLSAAPGCSVLRLFWASRCAFLCTTLQKPVASSLPADRVRTAFVDQLEGSRCRASVALHVLEGYGSACR